jgi:hypothetical protein
MGEESYSLTTVKSREKESTITDHNGINTSLDLSNVGSSDNDDEFSDNSDHLPDHYYIGPMKNKKGDIITYNEKVEKFK